MNLRAWKLCSTKTASLPHCHEIIRGNVWTVKNRDSFFEITNYWAIFRVAGHFSYCNKCVKSTLVIRSAQWGFHCWQVTTTIHLLKQCSSPASLRHDMPTGGGQFIPGLHTRPPLNVALGTRGQPQNSGIGDHLATGDHLRTIKQTEEGRRKLHNKQPRKALPGAPFHTLRQTKQPARQAHVTEGILEQ